MALMDIKRILRNYQADDYADTAYRIQFCSEKILKGLILLYGAQFKKIHTPSIIIKNEILTKDPGISVFESERLQKIIDDASILEELATIPRYGIEVNGQFIEPETIYNEESIGTIIPYLLDIIENLTEILQKKDDTFWKQIIEAFSNGRKELQYLLD